MAHYALRAKSFDAASLVVLGFGGPCRSLIADGAQGYNPVVFLHDVFGPLPFRHVTLDPIWLTWHGGIVPTLAQSIYDDRAFDRLPILADALEEAGCSNADILGHCRSPGPHVRGCWVVDLILGKE